MIQQINKMITNLENFRKHLNEHVLSHDTIFINDFILNLGFDLLEATETFNYYTDNYDDKYYLVFNISHKTIAKYEMSEADTVDVPNDTLVVPYTKFDATTFADTFLSETETKELKDATNEELILLLTQNNISFKFNDIFDYLKSLNIDNKRIYDVLKELNITERKIYKFKNGI
jgi:hypothetical protein